MRNLMIALSAVALVGSQGAPAIAKDKDKPRWEYDGRYYDSYESCKRAKDKSRDRAAIVGAASAGTVAAVAGGSLAETALVAGAGALAGSAIGKNAKKC